jgi:signal transduction histidine kinase
VRQEIARINHIVTDLLQMARPHPPRVRKSDLNTTVEHAVMLGRLQAASTSMEVVFTNDPTLPEVEHDSDQFHQVVINLLLNALQATEGQGKVTVTVKSQGDFAVVEVADNGHGIAPEHLPNIFRPFYTTKGDGTGLGLSLAQRIVEDHHGKIDVTSTVGQGTIFSVIVPSKPDSRKRYRSTIDPSDDSLPPVVRDPRQGNTGISQNRRWVALSYRRHLKF